MLGHWVKGGKKLILALYNPMPLHDSNLAKRNIKEKQATFWNKIAPIHHSEHTCESDHENHCFIIECRHYQCGLHWKCWNRETNDYTSCIKRAVLINVNTSSQPFDQNYEVSLRLASCLHLSKPLAYQVWGQLSISCLSNHIVCRILFIKYYDLNSAIWFPI